MGAVRLNRRRATSQKTASPRQLENRETDPPHENLYMRRPQRSSHQVAQRCPIPRLGRSETRTTGAVHLGSMSTSTQVGATRLKPTSNSSGERIRGQLPSHFVEETPSSSTLHRSSLLRPQGWRSSPCLPRGTCKRGHKLPRQCPHLFDAMSPRYERKFSIAVY